MNMHRELCERCGQPTNNMTIMSIFNTEVICMPCKDKEKRHPDYKKASDAELEAVRNGNMNFKGVGLPANYTEWAKNH